MKRIVGIIYFGFLVLLLSCVAEKQAAQDSISQTTESDEKILFLIFDVIRSENALEVALSDQKLVSGQLQDEGTIPHSHDHAWKVELLNSNNQSAKTLWVDNPLDKEIESFSEDGEITAQSVKLAKSNFFIRTNYSDIFRSVAIYKPTGGASGSYELIAKLTIDL